MAPPAPPLHEQFHLTPSLHHHSRLRVGLLSPAALIHGGGGMEEGRQVHLVSHLSLHFAEATSPASWPVTSSLQSSLWGLTWPYLQHRLA
jgi:hypothetical protein